MSQRKPPIPSPAKVGSPTSNNPMTMALESSTANNKN
jgi:hypothetical protein